MDRRRTVTLGLAVLSVMVGVTAVAVLLWAAGNVGASPPMKPLAQGGAPLLLNYQGRLADPTTGLPKPDGTYNITFTIYSAKTGGALIWSETQVVTVTRGLFNVLLGSSTPLSASDFDGTSRWLGLEVDREVLSPRMRIGSVPYAIQAEEARNAWRLTGNAGTNPTTNFLGTTDGVSLTLVVSGTAALRLEPDATSPNLIGGYSGNWVTAAVFGATIGGGGESGYPNRVTDDYGTVGGGLNNQAGDNAGTTSDSRFATVGGGQSNTASGGRATVGGGEYNAASNWAATVGGGSYNTASEDSSTVSGGTNNTASGTGATVAGGTHNTANGGSAGVTTIGGGHDNTASFKGDTVGGGGSNTASGGYATIGGGLDNTANGGATVGGGSNNIAGGGGATIGGGQNNTASGPRATIGGGEVNTASGDRATVGGGENNQASGDRATVGGGTSNTASGPRATIGGGEVNTASGDRATVGGGYSNVVTATYGTIGGGHSNTASGWTATIGGGENNQTSGDRATISGGWGNTAGGVLATVPGGQDNTAQGDYSFAAGRRAKAEHAGAFVWGDASDADVYSPADNTFIIRANGGLWFGQATDNFTPTIGAGVFISTSTGAYLSSGGTWTDASDRDLKENFALVDGQEALARLTKLPISTWNYKAEDASIRHMGSTAQDFYATFGLGQDDRHIAPLDASGVALAAIQGLYQLSQEQAARIEELEAENATLQQRLDDLEARVVAFERTLDTGRVPASSNSLPTLWLLFAGLPLLGLVVSWRQHMGGGR